MTLKVRRQSGERTLDLSGSQVCESGIQEEFEKGLKKLLHEGKTLSATANQQGGILKVKACEKTLLCCADNLISGYFVACLPQIFSPILFKVSDWP